MKKKLAQRLLLLLLLAAAAPCVHAAQQQANRIAIPKVPGISVLNNPMTPKQASSEDVIYQSPAKDVSKAINKNDEELATVTCVFVCDANDYNFNMAKYTFFDSNGNRFIKYGYEEPTIELPKGVYDIVAQYRFRGNPNHWNQVIREQVNIDQDTTITTDAQEAIVHIQFQPRLPNGEVCRPETLLYHEDYTYEVIDEGNIGDLCFDLYLIDKNSGKMIDGYSANWANIWTGFIDRDATHNSDVYVNAFSDRFVYTCTMAFPAQPQDGNFYQVNFQADCCKDSIISNNPEDYLSANFAFKQSVASKTNGEDLEVAVESMTYEVSSTPLGGWGLDLHPFTLQDGETCRYSICNAFNTQAYTINTLSPIAFDGIDDWDWQLYMRDQAIINDNGNLRFLTSGLGGVKEWCYYLRPDESFYPFYSNPIYSYAIDKRMTITGNSCPINISMPSFMMMDENLGNIEQWFIFATYLGRNGEMRERDRYLVHTNINVDGVNIVDSDGQYYYEWTKNAESQGLVDITVTNENVDVDGLPGKNVTNIHFDMAGDDNTAPTLQMLDFRDKEDNAIDRFATADNGKLQFYCGDFNERYQYISNYDDYLQYFVCNDLASVEVAYSPYQADSWTALDASEVAEYYYDGMGHYYAAPLASVTGKGLEGWFDLKIRLEDAAGNWQEQVISPAFRIDELAYSGIAAPRGSAAAHEVARYNLAGQRVDANATGIVIVKMSDGTARKVMVK